MILNLHSLAFNTETASGGGNPAWGTEMGQGDGYRFHFEDSDEFITALVYMSVQDPQKRITCPLGKGGGQAADYEFVLGSLFDKIFVNGLKVKGKFVLLVVKKLVGANHVGRRTLKYSPRMTLDGKNYNDECYKEMARLLGVSEKGSWFVSEIKVRNQDELHFTAHILDANNKIVFADSEDRSRKLQEKLSAYAKDAKDSNLSKYVASVVLNEPLQQIFFGAPGTGKSHEINEQCCKYEHFRITFHPDTDYASFVGAYKPSTYQEQVVTNMGEKAIPLKDSVTGANVTTAKITYSYVFQAFLKAYVAAWKEQQKETPAPVFLIIEEINRGNCAQIFGDIFQLLDRNKLGFSDYPIVADDDLEQELKKVFEDLEVVNAATINSLYEGGHDVVDGVKTGSHLLLPNNLYIWATMNTSDQSLFPIDSAFKRRWDWKYIKIKNSSKNYRIVFSNGNEYDWWEFLMAINDRIEGGDIQQEDKKLGYFFVKPKEDGVISAEMFLSKVIFYLYNDVFKDFGFEEDFFKDEDGRVMAFASYFDSNGEVDENRVERFITNVLDLDVLDYSEESAEESGQTQGNDGGRDHTKFRINGKGEPVGKGRVAVELVKTYVSQHPRLNASEIIEAWKPFEKFVSHFMESEEEYNQRVNIEGKQPRAEKIDCGGGGAVYIATNGYGTLEKMRKLQELLKETDLGLEISPDKNETAD